MNSDKIERLQRASAMTAPEVSRSTETPFPRPCCASTPKQRRWDCATLGLVCKLVRFGNFNNGLFFFGGGSSQNAEMTLEMRGLHTWRVKFVDCARVRWNARWSEKNWSVNADFERESSHTGSYGCLWHDSCVCVCVCVLHLGKKKSLCLPPWDQIKVWHRVWSLRADNESCIAFILALGCCFACADLRMWPFPLRPTSVLFPLSLFQ